MKLLGSTFKIAKLKKWRKCALFRNPLETADKTNIILVINESITYKNDMLFNSIMRPNVCKRLRILLFAKNMGENIGQNMSKNVSVKYSQNFLDHAKKSTSEALKNSFKRVIQKTAEATGFLIGNEIADKKTSPKNNPETNEVQIHREKYICPEHKQKVIDDLRLKKD